MIHLQRGPRAVRADPACKGRESAAWQVAGRKAPAWERLWCASRPEDHPLYTLTDSYPLRGAYPTPADGSSMDVGRYGTPFKHPHFGMNPARVFCPRPYDEQKFIWVSQRGLFSLLHSVHRMAPVKRLRYASRESGQPCLDDSPPCCLPSKAVPKRIALSKGNARCCLWGILLLWGVPFCHRDAAIDFSFGNARWSAAAVRFAYSVSKGSWTTVWYSTCPSCRVVYWQFVG